jgi:hypothetical protein
MPWTKRDIVKQAFSEMGKGDYDFDLQPEECQSALRQLDAMVAGWGRMNIRIAFAGGIGFGDIDAETNVPEYAVEALYLNLAMRLCPSYGKTPSPVTAVAAKIARDALLSRATVPRKLSGYGGSGRWRQTNLPEPEPVIDGGPGRSLDFGASQ